MKVGDLVRVTHGSGSGTIGLIVAILGTPIGVLMVRLETGKHFAIDRLEVLA